MSLLTRRWRLSAAAQGAPLSATTPTRPPSNGGWLTYAFTILAGAMHAAALAWPFDGEPVWWLSLLSLALFAGVMLKIGAPQPTGLRHRPVVQGALLGVTFATAWLSCTFWWLFISLHTYGGLHAALAVVAVLGLALFLAFYYAVACVLWVALKPRHWIGSAVVFAALWMMAELARGTWLTGFPWGANGYAHVQGPLSVLPRYVGVYGTGAVAAFLAMLLALLCAACLSEGVRPVWRRGLRSPGVWAAAIAFMVLWAGAVAGRWCDVHACSTSNNQDSTFSVALLQGNIPQDEKFQPGSGVPMALAWYAQAIQDAPASLVVAPETAIPLLPSQLNPGYLEQLTQHFVQADSRRALMLGLPLGDAHVGYTNSVLGFAATPQMPLLSEASKAGDVAAQYQYDKHHLVPFGEFIPPLFRWFTEMMNIPLGDFNRGAVGQASFAWAGERIAPNICYEDLFGEEIAARFQTPEMAPTVLMNFSNIGWFGDSLAIDQHLQISRMRALEFERPMVRATNTGATVVIDHHGAVTYALPRLTRGVLLAKVQGRGGQGQGGVWRTPYAAWAGYWGLTPLWLMALATLLVAYAARRFRPVTSHHSHECGVENGLIHGVVTRVL